MIMELKLLRAACVALTLLVGSAFGADVVPQEVQSVITQVLTEGNLVGALDDETNKVSLGFAASDRLSDVSAGTPFRVYEITPTKISAASSDAPVSSIVEATDRWHVPLIVRGQMVCLLTVGRSTGVWKFAGIGAAPLARAWQRVVSAWPAEQGYSLVYIKVQSQYASYFVVTQRGDHNLTRIVPVPETGEDGLHKALQVDYSAITSSSQVVAALKANQASRSKGGAR